MHVAVKEKKTCNLFSYSKSRRRWNYCTTQSTNVENTFAELPIRMVIWIYWDGVANGLKMTWNGSNNNKGTLKAFPNRNK